MQKLEIYAHSIDNYTFIPVEPWIPIHPLFIGIGLFAYFFNLIVCTPLLFIILWYEINAFSVHHRTMINQMMASVAVLVSFCTHKY